jgi:hypothetical protein
MISNPHDALFKAVFGQPEHARGELCSLAPSALVEALDWSTLTLRPGSFVDAALRHQHTDLLYSAMRRDGGETLVYFLFEHQSTPSPRWSHGVPLAPLSGADLGALVRRSREGEITSDGPADRDVSRWHAVVGTTFVRCPDRRPR